MTNVIPKSNVGIDFIDADVGFTQKLVSV